MACSPAAATPLDVSVTASPHYSGKLNAIARRLGWEQITVMQPDDRLTATDTVSAPERP